MSTKNKFEVTDMTSLYHETLCAVYYNNIYVIMFIIHVY